MLWSTRRSPRLATPRTNRTAPRARLWLSRLEERAVPATIAVTTNLDTVAVDGLVSIREALNSVNNGANANADVTFTGLGYGNNDSITFAGVVSPISLTAAGGNQLTISKSVTVTGPGSGLLTIQNTAVAGTTSRVFTITAGTVAIGGLTISGGNATANGGGILTAATTTLSGVVVTGNKTTLDGGGISVSAGTLTINDSVVSSNTATGTASQGGGIQIGGAQTLTLSNTTVTGNSSGEDGGGIYFFSGGTFVMTGSTVSGNKSNTGIAGNGGGGIYLFNTITTIRNSTISGNSTNSGGFLAPGGGISSRSGVAAINIQATTIAFNDAGSSTGGGIDRNSTAVISIVSTIISNNTATTGPDYSGTLASAISSLIGDPSNTTITSDPTPTVNGDPLLVALASNGGLTMTHALGVGSPALNVGANLSPNSQRFDQRGAGNTRSYGVSDIGAYEFVTANFPSASANVPNVTAPGGTAYLFSVDFYDDIGVDTTTITTAAVTLTGPNAFGAITLVNITGAGSSVTANYSAVPPGGTFDGADNGVYTLNIVGGIVSDGANFVPGGANNQFFAAVPSVIVVNSLLDEIVDTDAKICFREAIVLANSVANTNDTINFDPLVFVPGTVYTLTLGGGGFTDSVVINGPGVANLKVDGNAGAGLTVAANLTVSVSGIEFANFSNATIGAVGNIAIGATLNVTNAKFTNNKTTSTTGGGVFGLLGANTKLNITNSTFTGNQVSGNTTGDGGIIRGAANSFVTIVDSTVSGNTAGDDGGAIYLTGGSLSITGSTFSGNKSGTLATSDGGAIFSAGTIGAGGYAIRNSTFSGNMASGSGGAIHLNSTLAGTTNITNSTFTLNSTVVNVGGFGGAINRQGSTLNLESNIISGNTLVAGAPAANGPDVFGAAFNTFKFNAVGTSTGFPAADVTNLVGTAVALDPLSNSGGATETHVPSPGSPVRNAGSNPAVLTTDQRGNARVQQASIDIGSVESTGVIPIGKLTPLGPILTAGATPNQLVITYTDDNLIDWMSIDAGDIEIVAPNLSKLTISAASVDVMADGAVRIATYTFGVPGGTWDGGDNGTYTVNILANQVADKDAVVNFVLAGKTGSFQVGIPANYIVDNVGDVNDGDFTAGNFTLREALSLTNALAISTDTIGFGGAAFAGNATITLTAELPVAGNTVIAGTGSGKLTITGNSVGRIFNVNDATQVATFSISDVRLTGGKATGGGGAILNAGETINITNCLVEANTANTGNGGAISTIGGVFNIVTSTFANNVAVAGPGGAIDGNGGTGATLNVTDSTFSGNTSSSTGGAISVAYFVTNINSSTISGNKAANGGAFSFFNGTPTITNSTISGNTATTLGGGINLSSFNGILTVRNSTITANTSTGANAGGIGRTSGTGTISLVSTIVFGNTNAASPDLFTTGIVNADFCDIGSSKGVTTFNLTNSPIVGSNPNLGALLNNGGPTKTHALQVGSAALDLGSNPAGLTTDQRGAGFLRQLGGQVDIGAIEGIQANPTAKFNGLATIITPGPTPNTLTVTYTSPFSDIKVSTIDTSDITITAPNLALLPITGVTVDVNSDGTPRTATYTFTVPGGGWDLADNGNYTVALVANQVSDITNTFAFGGNLGSFLVAIPVSYVVDEVSDLDDGDFTVGKLSIREAITLANGDAAPSVITFSAVAFAAPQTIPLLTGEMAINEAVTITGPTAKLTLEGDAVASATNRIFNTIAAPASADIRISGMTLSKGNVTGNGGAIAIGDESLTLTNVAVSDSIASAQGGGIHVSVAGATLNIINSTLSNNASTAGGGVTIIASATLFVEGSTFIGNQSTIGNSGGAIRYTVAFPANGYILRNSTFTGNSSLFNGGALGFSSLNGTALIQNCTITGNSAAGGGGGIGVNSSGTGILLVESSIVSGNLATGTGPDFFFTTGTVTANKSIIGSQVGITTFVPDATTTALLGVAPGLGPIGSYGGPTQTFGLLPGSPGIDAGSNPASLPFDQRGPGFVRQLGAGVDIGSFEGILTNPSGKLTPLGPIVTPGATPNTVVVTYSDNTGILVSSIDIGDIEILNPLAVPLVITGVAVDINSDGTPRVATYTFTVPGGAWDGGDNGAYTINLKVDEITDTDTPTANKNLAAALGSFTVAIPIVYLVDEATDIDDGDFTVGKLSLREAIGQANGDAAPSTIGFSAVTFALATTIVQGSELLIAEPVTITGPTAKLTLDAASSGRLLNIDLTTANGDVSISRLTFTNGLVAGSNGGGILSADANLTLTNVVVTGNSTDLEGGGISLTTATKLNLIDSTVSKNKATGVGSNGGGIDLRTASAVTVLRSTVSGNEAGEDGGGIYFFSGGSLTMDDSTLSGNTANIVGAGVGGGGVYLFNTVTVIRNSTISGNTTNTGGGGGIGIFNTANTTIKNSTIAFNVTLGAGGGGIGTGTAKLTSTILAGNSSATANNADFNVAITADFSLIGVSAGGVITGANNKLDVASGLAALAANGGPTMTHDLNAGSAAINNGSNPDLLANDQRGLGFARIVGSQTDIGAFETVPPVVVGGKISINDGKGQRSLVTTLSIPFSIPVSFVGNVVDAFQLDRVFAPVYAGVEQPGVTGLVNISAVYNPATFVVTLSFLTSGANPINAIGGSFSLPDGRYSLTILSLNISGSGNLDGNGDGNGGDNYVLPAGVGGAGIYRLFGDVDGDGDNDVADFTVYRSFNGTIQPSVFDYDGDGDTDIPDFAQFRIRFGRTLP